MIIYLECILLCISSHQLETWRATYNVSFWCCTRWGLHPICVSIDCRELLPRVFTLTTKVAVIFCCTFLRITPTRRYLAPCSIVSGLSSGHKGKQSSEILHCYYITKREKNKEYRLFYTLYLLFIIHLQLLHLHLEL